MANTCDAAPVYTEAEKHEAFEWLRLYALSGERGSRMAAIALCTWAEEKADAERYRWLRGDVAFNAGLHVTRSSNDGIDFCRGEYLDKAVDESMERYSRSPQSREGS